MASRIWIAYGIACCIMASYLVWTIHVMNRRGDCPVSQYVTDFPGKQSSTISAPVEKEPLKFSPYLPTFVDINPDIHKFFTLTESEDMDPFVNLHRYRLTINSKKCSDSDIFLIMLVHSAPANFRKRSLIRTTYGSVRSHKGRKLAVVFLLGAVTNTTVQSTVKMEAKRHGDIVQADFPDSYKSLIRKHVMVMHWYKHHCSADFILKLDDDTFVNPFRLVNYILQTKPHGLIIHCKVISESMPVRNIRSKWHTSDGEYPFSLFPPFCLGFAYITTPSTMADLYIASKTTRVMNMDDVYVSTVLAMKAHVHKLDFEKILDYCPKNITLIDVKSLSEKAIFVDRAGTCGEKPFLLWKNVVKLTLKAPK